MISTLFLIYIIAVVTSMALVNYIDEREINLSDIGWIVVWGWMITPITMGVSIFIFFQRNEFRMIGWQRDLQLTRAMQRNKSVTKKKN